MEPIFTEDQLKNMSREALIELMQVMQEKQRKTETKMNEYSGWFYIICPVIWKSLFRFAFVHTES